MWWETLNIAQKIYFCIACPATVLLVVQVILLLVGFGSGGGDADTDLTYYDPILGKEVKLTAENIEAYKNRMDEAIESGQYTEEQKTYFYNYYNTLMEQLKNRQ